MAGRRGSNGAAAGAAMMASGCRGGRRARSSGGGVMARRSEAAAGQRARAASGVASGWQRRVLCRARREGRVSEGERGGREKKGVEREKKVHGFT